MTQLTDLTPDDAWRQYFGSHTPDQLVAQANAGSQLSPGDSAALQKVLGALPGDAAAERDATRKATKYGQDLQASTSKADLKNRYRMFRENLDQLGLPELQLKQRQQQLDAWATAEAHRLEAAKVLGGPENWANALAFYRGKNPVANEIPAFDALTNPNAGTLSFGAASGNPTPLSMASLDRMNGGSLGPQPMPVAGALPAGGQIIDTTARDVTPGVAPAPGTAAADQGALGTPTTPQQAAAPAPTVQAPAAGSQVFTNMGTAADTTNGQQGYLGQPFTAEQVAAAKYSGTHSNQWLPGQWQRMTPAEQQAYMSQQKFVGNDPGSVLSRYKGAQFTQGRATAA